MKHPQSKGFALVATLSLMILLTVIAVGLLTLSAVSSRGSSQQQARMEAQANARLALQIAIGELQKQMGPDQRISAKAAILDENPETPVMEKVNHPHWTGVWDSWIAGPVDLTTVNSSYPEKGKKEAQSAHSTIQPPTPSLTGVMAPKYPPDSSEKGRSDYFRSWLASLSPEEAADMASAQDLVLAGKRMPKQDETAIELVGEGSLEDEAPEADKVSVRLINVSTPTGGKGRYAWWVGDESQKARVMHDSYVSTPPANSAEKIFRSQSPGSTGTKSVKDLEGMTVEQEARLKGLPTRNTLDLVVNDANKQPARKNFHHVTSYSSQVLADVREGGLKRDLSVILEQPIDLANQGPEYMLYEFDDARFPYLNNVNDARRANSRVPIQDLAAYYQLYNDIKPTDPTFGVAGREGVRYTSTQLANSIQINVPDYDGGNKIQQRLNREYTSLYRRPVVTKVQFLLGVTAQPITQPDRDRVQAIIDGTVTAAPYGPAGPGLTWKNNLTANPLKASDTHRLRLGIQPLVTLWNPTNLPLVMNSSEILTYTAPPFGIRIRKYPAAGAPFDSAWMNLSYANTNVGGTTAGQGTSALLRLRLGNNPIVFQPGEVKVFSLSTSAANLTAGGSVLNLDRGTTFNVVNTWDPYGLFLMRNSAPAGPFGNSAPHVFPFTLDNNAQCLVFGPNDSISISVDSENASSATDARDGRNSSRDSEIRGAGFGLHMVDEGYIVPNPQVDALRHNFMISRHGSGTTPNRTALGGFYQQLMAPGFPGGVTPLPADAQINAIPASQIIASIAAKEIIAIMDFSLSVGCETSSAASGGSGGGRRITSRPFLHSSTSAMPFIAQSEKDSLYDYGWDWQLNKINTVEDSILQAKPGTGNGYYGGGYTVELGTTHVIQSEIPVLPPISIASLSHAHLGGFSMAKAIPVGENPDTDKYNWNQTQVQDPTGVSFQRVTASGQNGLAPHISQAIGNSYAHPNIPANKSFITKQRTFDLDNGTFDIPYVDHSYLANKALWDEYFFSSMSPQPAKVELFGASNPSKTAKAVADAFFNLSDPLASSPLPNRRIKPYTKNLNQSKLDTLFTQAGVYTNGLADKIAAHMMVEGAFNVNSTSVDAWKVFLSSLKGKPVAYLDGGTSPKEAATQGTTISPGSLPNGAPIKSADITGANDPVGQWTSGRELTDDEIEELAYAMVKQVKLRGPFLSLSEFVNRRLEGDKGAASERSVKGALQAALDDPDYPTSVLADADGQKGVAINASFRTPSRLLDSETASIPFSVDRFADAAKGPIAYGSQPYVDQADVLRGLAEQLTPRGDTFVIRTYGDSLDAAGNVVARAWCEAVVQRIPDYVDPQDEDHIRSADLKSESNRKFGRDFNILSFRWLNSNEV